MAAENIDIETETVTLIDKAKRSLTCYVEHFVKIAGEEYVVLLPLDAPVEIFAWPEDAEEPIPIENSVEIAEEMFAVAKAVLAEKDLTLQRTAERLTVAGELPELNLVEEELDPDTEEFIYLAKFYYKQEEYYVYAPLDPLLLLAKMNDAGQPELLSPEELSRIEHLLPEIEAQLLKALNQSQEQL